MLRIREVTHDAVPQVVFDLAAFGVSGNAYSSSLGTYAYRSHRIPDFYAHPAQPVADLTVQLNAYNPILQFSADSARTYSIQASSDMAQWEDLGQAESAGNGNLFFTDFAAAGVPARFYRVVTN
jgi:hypothetical protein